MALKLPVSPLTPPPLDLELLHPGIRRRRAGTVMLAIGVGAAVVLGIHMLETRQALQHVLAKAAVPVDADKTAIPAATPKEIEAAQAGIRHLSLPWGTLFSALEEMKVEDARLIAVEPDADHGKVRVMAEATDVYGMLDYMRALAERPGLRMVTLEQFEVSMADVDQPVRFALKAEWLGE